MLPRVRQTSSISFWEYPRCPRHGYVDYHWCGGNHSLDYRVFFKQLLITSFDELLAKAMGMPVNFYHYLLMVLLTLVSVTAMQSVGTILIVAMLITPAATAYLYANSLRA